ncbi:MAG: ATP-binding protein [Succinivibrionaceae bacterium]|nr:ATP-binding protein [Succinivibrionaceae bacterium]MDY6274105.1 ATP-binding protein [Succinivibrionaceae bacterium]
MTENMDGSMEEIKDSADRGFGQDISELIRRKKEETAAENAADGTAGTNGTASSQEVSISDGDIARLTERKRREAAAEDEAGRNSFSSIIRDIAERSGFDLTEEDPYAGMSYEDFRRMNDRAALRDNESVIADGRRERAARLLEETDINPDWTFSRMTVDSGNQAVVMAAEQYINDFISCMRQRKEREELSREAERGYSDAIMRLASVPKRHFPSLLIWGEYGVGKSMLAGSIAHELLKKGITVIFSQFADIIRKIYYTKNEDNLGYQRQLENVDLLIIDEVGVDRREVNENQAMLLGKILRTRYNRGLGAILITNQKPDESGGKSQLHMSLTDYSYESIKMLNPLVLELRGRNRRRVLTTDSLHREMRQIAREASAKKKAAAAGRGRSGTAAAPAPASPGQAPLDQPAERSRGQAAGQAPGQEFHGERGSVSGYREEPQRREPSAPPEIMTGSDYAGY